ncbi:hypothetical protein [Streptomyces sp. AV19]|nr:hypothetical protein [Streptomyces sp. AV19]MDG4536811.1 hypothetical protein [Streptomyces sp. AV19]
MTGSAVGGGLALRLARWLMPDRVAERLVAHRCGLRAQMTRW